MSLLAILCITVSISTVYCYCPHNCFCNEHSSICNLKTCKDDIPQHKSNELQIHGSLCNKHRTQLKHKAYQETVIVLFDDYCHDLMYCL